MPFDSEIENAMKTNVLTNKQAAGVLYLIESSIRDRSRHSTQLLGLNKYSLEHVMPKKWQNHWAKPDTQQQIIERDRKLLTLGNLTIITQALNASIRDADWDVKKAGRGDVPGLKKYAEGIDTFSDYLAKDVWNEDVIEERATFLLGKALEVWEVPYQETIITDYVNENWNGEYYISYGVGQDRTWEDALKYGFVSAGGGAWYSRTLSILEIGSRVWVNIPGEGYVGVGTVVDVAKPTREVKILIDGQEKDFHELPLTANYNMGLPQEKCEYIVCVDWIKTVEQSEAVKERGFFGNQNSAARPTADSWNYTVNRLKELWDIDA
jgi:hypothetical protein